MKGFVYLLISQKDKRTYIGSTTDVDRRLGEHNSGKSAATRARLPLTLVYSEEYESIDEARKREHFLKSRSGRRELARIFEKFNLGE